MISEATIEQCLELIKNPNGDYFSKSRDIFTARLDSYIAKTGKYLESALIGEIGNNTFDHNFSYNKPFLHGAYFKKMGFILYYRKCFPYRFKWK